MAAACMFCGGKPTTGEHVFPDWTEKWLPPSGGLVTSGRGDPRWRVSPGKGQRANVACGPCNHGWMSRLEARVEPLIGPTIRNPTAPLSLTPRDQRLVAAWSSKTALVIQGSVINRDTRYIPESNLGWFRDGRKQVNIEPPPYTRVWVFLRWPVMLTGQGSRTFAMSMNVATGPEHSAIPESSRVRQPNGFVVTFGIGFLGFHVTGQDEPIDGESSLIVDRALADALDKMLIPIWPTLKPRNRWPPERVLDAIDVDLLGRWGQRPDGPWPRPLFRNPRT